jgi:hypothetical protein
MGEGKEMAPRTYAVQISFELTSDLAPEELLDCVSRVGGLLDAGFELVGAGSVRGINSVVRALAEQGAEKPNCVIVD